MNKKSIVMLIAVLALAPVLVSAAPRMNGGDKVSIERADVVTDDAYLAGGMLTLAGSVAGDFIGAGGSVFVSGSTTNDVIVAGGSLVITGSVGDDLRAAGGNITISSAVGDDVVVAGGQVTIVSGAVIGGDLIVVGGQVTVDGAVRGTIRATGGEVTINGQAGDVFVKSAHVIIGPSAEIEGAFTYESPEKADIRDGSVIAGATTYTQIKSQARNPAGFLSFFLLIKVLSLFVVALVLQWLLKGIAVRVVSDSLVGVWHNIGRGFVALIVIPVAIGALMFTVVGIPLGFFGLFMYFALMIFTCLFVTIFLGGFIAKLYTKSETVVLDWKTALLGALATLVLSLVPIIGGLVLFISFLITLGAIVKLKISYFKNLRQSM